MDISADASRRVAVVDRTDGFAGNKRRRTIPAACSNHDHGRDDSHRHDTSIMTETDDAETRLKELPPSAKLVYQTLEYADGELSQSEVAARSLLTTRTTRSALYELEDAGLIEYRLRPTDLRRKCYQTVK